MNRFKAARLMMVGLWLFIPWWALTAQEDGDFGFGFEDEPGSAAAASGPRVQVSGEVGARLLGFGDDFSSEERLRQASLGDIFSGALNFSAAAFNADGVINLKPFPVWDGSSPVSIDEWQRTKEGSPENFSASCIARSRYFSMAVK